MNVDGSRPRIALGYVFAVLEEYIFSGRIAHVHREVDMIDVASMMRLRNTNVSVVVREYETDSKGSHGLREHPRTASRGRVFR